MRKKTKPRTRTRTKTEGTITTRTRAKMIDQVQNTRNTSPFQRVEVDYRAQAHGAQERTV